ncbi:MAG: bifunctional hydroxymethylpyrimidine kinase/phosphomethylpyrimidine kinase [Caldilineales bacterium]|nr:bifunctional hydroxymethylpyrimidine kinase/phosphomethylpyrimidine kinase [Caldilineales bacterium]
MSAAELVARLAGQRLLVVGDLVLDEYQIGRVSRLSREAPVPVLEQTRAEFLPGGACNPAANIHSLGSAALLVGLLGQDEAAARLTTELQRRGLDIPGLLVDPARPTTHKIRIVAEGSYVFAHHLARVDRLSQAAPAEAVEQALCDRIAALAPGCAAVLISDYCGGVITPAVIAAARAAARSQHALAIVDSQGDLGRFTGFDLIRCNRQEAERYLGRALEEDAAFAQALAQLLARLDAGGAVITRGAEGLSLMTRGGEAQHLASANRSQVFDVTGAGDTLIAVIALALAAGLDLRAAAGLGNAAAGVAVRRLGNVAVTPPQLLAALLVDW